MKNSKDLEAALRITIELESELRSTFDTPRMASTAPTRPAYGDVSDVPMREKDFALWFKEKLACRNQHLRDYYEEKNDEYKLKRFQSLTLESSPFGDYNTSVASFLAYFRRDRLLLERETTFSRGDHPEDMIKFGKQVREARDRKGHTAEQAAEAIGCDPSTISRVEQGTQKPKQHANGFRDYIAPPN